AVESGQRVVAGFIPRECHSIAVALDFYAGHFRGRFGIPAAVDHHVADAQGILGVGAEHQTVRVALLARHEALALLGLRRSSKLPQADADDHPVLARPADLAPARLGEVALDHRPGARSFADRTARLPADHVSVRVVQLERAGAILLLVVLVQELRA